MWLGNNRGNKYSRRHTKLHPWRNRKKFFDYSFPEMAIYDMTSFIDYVLKETKQPKLFYAGHSQGTTQFSTKR